MDGDLLLLVVDHAMLRSRRVLVVDMYICQLARRNFVREYVEVRGIELWQYLLIECRPGKQKINTRERFQ